MNATRSLLTVIVASIAFHSVYGGGGDYEYIGCYRDTSTRALRNGPHAYGYTPATCSVACSNYKYFALQNGGWCCCDNSLSHSTRYGTMTSCPATRLGAGWANDLFQNIIGDATVTIHCDNYGTVDLSTDGGVSFETIATGNHWPTAISVTIEDDKLGPDTILKLTCRDVGGIGGVIGTVSYNGNTYSTAEPIEDGLWELMSSSDDVYTPLVYHDKCSTPWSISTAGIADDAKWIWNENTYNTMVFAFDFENILPIPATAETVASEASGKSFSIDCGDEAILITSATYGLNCGATYNNQLNNLKAACNYENSCDYTVNHGIIGDPAVGCAKTYQYEYECVVDSDVYEYVGCYRDTSTRALPYGPHAYGYTPETCSIACAAYKYFALQNGGWCCCGNDLDYATQYGTMTNCPASQLGAGWANDLFENIEPETVGECTLGVNYNFEGSACIISGDPHFKIFNGNNHDLQMNPDIHKQFFMVAPCAGSDDDDMPLRILGTVYRWGGRSVTGLDYVVVILTDTTNSEQFFVYLSSAFAKYTADTATASTDYYENTASLTSLTSGTDTALGSGGRFSVKYTQTITNKRIYVEITIDGSVATVYLDGQVNVVGGIYRMHYGQISVPSSLKCHTCGICGDFKRTMTGLTTEYLETCSGGLVGYRAGWSAGIPEAYDANGWTWEYNYAMNHCVEGDYNIQDNLEGYTPEDPCSEEIADAVATACEAAMAAEEVCCDFIGGTFCTDFVEDCKVDACAAADGDASAIDTAVEELFTEAVDGVCDNLALHEFSKFEGYQCLGSTTDVLRDFVGTAEECAQKCLELDGCVGFIRVNSGSSAAGKCYFRAGTIGDPYEYNNDDRDCYIPVLFDIGFEYTSTETGCDGEEAEIGWVRYSECEENAGHGSGSQEYPTLTLSEMIDLAKYAVTVKILPKDDIPGQSETDAYAVTTCMCSNPIFALNNGKEMSYQLSYHTGLITAISQYEDNWMGSDTALDRLRNSCIPGGIGGSPRDLSTGIIYHACGNGATGLHLFSQTCMWEWREVMSPREDVVVWLGFYATKHKKCEEYAGYETTAEPTGAPTTTPATTCTLNSYSLGDDWTTVTISQDGGASFESYREMRGWNMPLAFEVDTLNGGISENTVLRYTVRNFGGPGGFAATLTLTSDDDPTLSTTFLTDNSQTNFQYIAAASTSTFGGDYSTFGSGRLGGTWNVGNYPLMDAATVISNDVDTYSYTTYEIDFSNFPETLTALGCYEPTALTGYTKYEDMNCVGSASDVLRDFVGSPAECAAKCDELDDCVGFIRVNSGSIYAGKCYFRGGTLSTPTNAAGGDDRDCYVPNVEGQCVLGEDYAFEGSQCILSGDPHFRIWNGNTHDFQGNPDINNQFFLVAPCFGSTADEMPLSILGTFYFWGTTSMTGMEYAVIMLTDTTADEQFYIFFASGFAAYTAVSDSTSTDYYENTGLTSLTAGEVTELGTGGRFTVSFTQLIDNQRALMEVGIDGEEATIYLDGQTNLVDGIYKMHYTQISIPSTLKCHACGLCGDFKNPMTGEVIEYLETCSGGSVGYRAGFRSWITEAYDANGWTWEYNYATNYCEEGDYDITDNLQGATPEDACTDDMAEKVAVACDIAYADAADCCEEIEDGELCPMLLTSCKIDACVAAEGDESLIHSEVANLFNEAVDGLCSIETAVTTCSLQSFSLGDDDTYVSVSRDGGVTFTDYTTNFGWNQLLGFTLGGITEETILKYKVVNSGSGPGGFAATLTLTSDHDTSQTTTILTDNPLTNFQVYAAESTSTFSGDYSAFGAGTLGGTWKVANFPQIDPNTAINYDIDPLKYTTYVIDFANFEDTLQEMGCTDTTTTKTPTTTSTETTPTTTFGVCDSDDALNVAFLLDESFSVDLDEWNVVKAFVEKTITMDISPVSSVKMWKYATYSFFQEIGGWEMNDQNGGQSTLVSAIQNTGWSKLGLTMTWDATNRVLDDFWDYRFSCTDGCETRSDVLFLITDGLPTGEAVCPDMEDRMSQSDVDIVLLIVDADAILDDTSAIDCLDTNNNQEDVIRLEEFTSAAFDAIEARIRAKTCSGNNPAGPGERPAAGSQWVYEDGSVGLGPVPEHERTGGNEGNGDATAAKVAVGHIQQNVGNKNVGIENVGNKNIGNKNVGDEDMFKLRHVAGDDEETFSKKKYDFTDLEGMFMNAIFNGLIMMVILAAVCLLYSCYQKMKNGNRYKMVDFDVDDESDDINM